MVLATPPALPPPTTTVEAPARGVRAGEVIHEAPPADLVRDILELPERSGPATVLEQAHAAGAAIESLRVGAEVPESRTLAEGWWGEVVVDAGSRVQVSFDGPVVTIRVQEGLRIDPVVGPDVRITSIRYDTENDRLDVDAEGVGPDGMYGWIAESIANRYMLDLVPTELRTSASPDAADADALTRAMALLNNFGGAPAAGVGEGSSIGLADPFGSVVLRIDQPRSIDIGDGYTLDVPRNARLTMSADLDGSGDSLEISQIRVRATGPEITVTKSEGFGSSVSGLILRGATISHGGAVHADYDLQLEQAIGDGMNFIRVLAGLASLEAGDARGLAMLNQPSSQPRLPALRADVDATISSLAEPELADWVRANDGLIEGESLCGLLGISKTP